MEQETKENQAFEYAKEVCMDYMVHRGTDLTKGSHELTDKEISHIWFTPSELRHLIAYCINIK